MNIINICIEYMSWKVYPRQNLSYIEKRIKKYLNNFDIFENSTILDIGSNKNKIFEYCVRNNININKYTSIENDNFFEHIYAEHANNYPDILTFYIDSFENVAHKLQNESFDIILALACISYINMPPYELFEYFYKLLTICGTLIIESTQSHKKFFEILELLEQSTKFQKMNYGNYDEIGATRHFIVFKKCI